jgi:2-oxoisovalerate dehydrogenase E1 component
VFRGGYDWFYSYYRDRALCLSLGMTAAEMLYAAVGAAADPASGGRQMPSHWGHKALNIATSSSPTGTQFLQGVGAAEGSLRASLLGITDGFHDDEVVFVSTGEGTTSQGEVLGVAEHGQHLKLPVVYLVEDNGYAISVPVEVNTAGGSISNLVAGFPDLHVERVDGCDLLASYEALWRAVRPARSGAGPALVHAKVHPPVLALALRRRDPLNRPPEGARGGRGAATPLTTFPAWLLANGHAKPSREIAEISGERRRRDPPATDDALAPAAARPETCTTPSTRPTSTRRGSSSTPRTTRSSPAARRR